MRRLLSVALALAALVVQAASHHEIDFTVCEDAPFVPSSVTLDPYPPHPGSEIVLQIEGVADHTMEGGEFYADVTLVVYHHHIPMYKEKKDLCRQTACPIDEGNVTFTYDKVLPPAVPAGLYNVNLQAEDLDGNLEMCLDLSFHITYFTEV
ncbi:unnamed protein product [Ostreobium quekettii]|uniref:MD-2-related lipid-recognition domain-containing protein n=1 Tax=Ostreobium quekettii TaxID=121088 RepID=A0A8S1IY39_9CHLO|nr:unnamed protein product [Ostreobium quekettii]|eukprot:evm.model.scf_11.4 EVM.evm.TU.scf_11.4   scf_11:25839-27069(-)